MAQRADPVRLPWDWDTASKSRELYTPVVSGKWWSHTDEQLQVLKPNKRRDVGHIGRIMETELGEELLGDRRCQACKDLGQECWVYSAEGARQVARPGDTCARCRVAARAGGCSYSKRKRKDVGTIRNLPPKDASVHRAMIVAMLGVGPVASKA
ncbi:hypothetical protein LTR28_011341 [Elasticomyces elasticus]|nr:hypothetical protein LTR28_011341 [Elasticomyces elasticus]